MRFIALCDLIVCNQTSEGLPQASNTTGEISKFEQFTVARIHIVLGLKWAEVTKYPGRNSRRSQWCLIENIGEGRQFAWPVEVREEAYMQLFLGKRYLLPLQSVSGWLCEQKFDMETMPSVALALKDHILFHYLAKYSYCQLSQKDQQSGDTVLLIAAENNDFNSIKEFQKHGLDILEYNEIGVGVVHHAARSGNIEILKYIMKHTVGVLNDIDADGWSAADYAIRNAKWEVVIFLLSHGASKSRCVRNGNDALLVAAELGDLRGTKMLVENGWDIFARNKHRDTAAHIAAKEGQLQTLRYFVNQLHLDINSINSRKNTVLHSAIRANRPTCVSFLLNECKPDLSLKNEDRFNVFELGSNLANSSWECHTFLEYWKQNNNIKQERKNWTRRKRKNAGRRRHYR